MISCLHKHYIIKSADNKIVRGNMDYASFALDLATLRQQTVVLPIEVKGPWQLDVEDWETLPRLRNGGE